MQQALVIYGINNLFTLKMADGALLEASIKGKTLNVDKLDYNPLACGDRVTLDENKQITQRLERKNSLQRLNNKGNLLKIQTLCANIDLVLCVVAINQPPLHSRFLDRLLISAEAGEVLPVIVINKADLAINDEELAHINLYQKLGYKVILTSTVNGQGLPQLKELCHNKTVALMGASGVGKSSLLNRLLGINLKTAELNKKFKRGNHTTNYAIFLEQPAGGYLIDTPGVRSLSPPITEAEQLAGYYRDFTPHITNCAYANCLHLNEEDCGIKAAVAAGLIDESRYRGYVKLIEEISEQSRQISRYKKM
ncbi:MAG: ribosome small subunit-dependent GTPase A [Spirochaetaceae bacterium]|nr:ribosome small subunit-dependent GTPase A [Spirochaetaceae bacterium]